MPLRLRLRQQAQAPLDLEGLLPERLKDLSLADVARLPIGQGNCQVPLGELFELSGSAADESLEIEGDLRLSRDLGVAMTRGTIRLDGHAGDRLGAGMIGGTIKVEADAGHEVGLDMAGGAILIRGSAGDGVASAFAGSKRGMTGGVILVAGSVGAWAGARMRRGLVVIGGACHHGLAHGMIAGTIVVNGSCTGQPGLEMKRGSLLFLGPTPRLPLTFRLAGAFRPAFLALLYRELDAYGLAIDPEIRGQPLQLYHGDRLALGKGEVWMRPCAGGGEAGR